MPLFYFDVYDNGRLSADDHGVECIDLREARDQAVGLLPDLARDELPDGETHSFVCVVRRHDGARCYRPTLTFNGTWTPGDEADGAPEPKALAARGRPAN